MTWFIVLLLVAIAVIAAAFVWRTYGGDVGSGFFGPKPERRLGVIEQASVDGKRRLILVRRDNVEHLIMTGGPVDVVVETGIGAVAAQRPRPTVVEATEPPVAFGRAPRTVGQLAGE
jgi:flagellar protein FliO/FliZ